MSAVTRTRWPRLWRLWRTCSRQGEQSSLGAHAGEGREQPSLHACILNKATESVVHVLIMQEINNTQLRFVLYIVTEH